METIIENTRGSNAIGVDLQRFVRPFWRLLNRHDVVRASDEFLTDDCETWDSCANAARFIVGQKYDPVFFQPMRRREDGTNNNSATAH